MADKNGTENLTFNQDLVTVRSIMDNLESDIEKILSGEMDDKTARIVVSARKTQLTGASLHLQAARLHAVIRKQVPGWLGTAKPAQG